MKFLTTPVGSFIKHFMSVILALYLAELTAGHDLFSMDVAMYKKIISGAVVSCLPIVINFLNPNYSQYGVKND